MESANYQEIQTLAGFIEKCEAMLKEADGLPNKQKIILERLEKCRSRLHLLLAGATLEAIHGRADGIRDKMDNLEAAIIENSNKNKKEIIDHIRRPVIDDKNKFKLPVMIILRKGSLSVSNEESKKFAGKGILEIKGGVQGDKKIKISASSFLLLYVLAKGSQCSKIPIGNRFYNDSDIKDAIYKWRDFNNRYIAGVIKRLKNDVLCDYKNLIESVYRKGYRISTHPQNIEIDEDVEFVLNKEISLDALIETKFES